MTAYIVFFSLVCGLLLWVTIRGKDAFPFSYYPMFSNPVILRNVVVYRVAFEKEDGTIGWWQSKFYRYPEIVGKKIGQLYDVVDSDSKQQVIRSLQRNKLLKDVLRIAELEYNISEYKSLHIVRRNVNDNLDISDTTIDQIAIRALKND